VGASAAALVFLRGGDADGRLRELIGERARLRPALAELAMELLRRRAHEPLGFRSLGDWSRERIGVGARAVRVPCSRETSTKWVAALELARRMAGENLPNWECAEAIAAECASALGTDENERARERAPVRARARRRSANEAPARRRDEAPVTGSVPEAPAREGSRGRGNGPDRSSRRQPPAAGTEREESGLRAVAWPHLRWGSVRAKTDDRLGRLTRQLDACSPRQLDRRFPRAIAFLQAADQEIGRILQHVVGRKLYRELGFESFERYVSERLNLSARTARRLVRLARAAREVPQVASAFREGRIALLQAEVLLRGGSVEWAERVTLLRLEEDVPERKVEFRAPPDVAELFLGLVRSVGLEAMLDHALATWLEAGSAFRDYADFDRDGYRCTVPTCSARRNLQSHHVWFRSAGGPGEPWNRTTLCAYHHERGVHGGTIAIRGCAPDGLIYELGVGRFLSGGVKA
jgi:hypothetical protein